MKFLNHHFICDKDDDEEIAIVRNYLQNLTDIDEQNKFGQKILNIMNQLEL